MRPITVTLHTYADGFFDAAIRSGGWVFVVMEEDLQIHANATGIKAGGARDPLNLPMPALGRSADDD